MKTIHSLVLIMVFTFISLLFPQSKGGIFVNGGANAGLGSFGDEYGTGYGVSATYFNKLNPAVDGTVTVGYNRWSQNPYTFSSIQVLAGVRYFLFNGIVRPYVPIYVGAYFVNTKIEVRQGIVPASFTGSGTSISDAETVFGFGAGLGVLIPINDLIGINLSGLFNYMGTKGTASGFIAANAGMQLNI